VAKIGEGKRVNLCQLHGDAISGKYSETEGEGEENIGADDEMRREGTRPGLALDSGGCGGSCGVYATAKCGIFGRIGKVSKNHFRSVTSRVLVEPPQFRGNGRGTQGRSGQEQTTCHQLSTLSTLSAMAFHVLSKAALGIQGSKSCPEGGAGRRREGP